VSGTVASPSSPRVDDLLRAACRVVVREGAHGLRMASVAREAGVSKALVHYYFSTRQELLRSAFAFSSEAWSAAVEERLAGLGTGAERVRAMLLATVDEVEPFAGHRALWNEVWSSLLVDEELRPLVERSYGEWVARLVALLREGRADGSVPRELDAETTGRLLAATADGIDSMLYLGLVDRAAARALLDTALAREVGDG
jgi:AcrR family transcriptional regulator